MFKRILVSLIVIFVALTHAKSQDYNLPPTNLSDSAQISILTSAPWPKEVYAVFGHSAMRVNDPVLGIDWVFNYGIFDFNKPNFFYRFMAGETDYMVAAFDFRSYAREYKTRGIDVHEQIISLTHDEKVGIWQFLVNNSLPENRVYRYNIFYNNCTTKLTDILEDNINGEIIYPIDSTKQTFRDLVHECVYQQPWVQFGIDLIIGSGADKIINEREKMFLPAYQMNTFAKTVIVKSGKEEPIVASTTIIVKALDNDETDSFDNSFFSPLVLGLIILFIAIICSLLNLKNYNTLGKIYDTLLFLIMGAGGCIIFFMMFFSVHPCTSNNWNLIWLNPFEFIAAFLFFVKPLAKYVYYYHFINFVVLILLLLAWCLIPQEMELAFIPYILAIALRSATFVYKQNKLIKEAV